MLFASALAICLTRLSVDTLASSSRAPLISPLRNKVITDLGMSESNSTMVSGVTFKLSTSTSPPASKNFCVSVAILSLNCAGDIVSSNAGFAFLPLLPCTLSTISATRANSCSSLFNFLCALGVSLTTFSAFFLGFLRSGVTCTLPLLASSIFLFLDSS